LDSTFSDFDLSQIYSLVRIRCKSQSDAVNANSKLAFCDLVDITPNTFTNSVVIQIYSGYGSGFAAIPETDPPKLDNDRLAKNYGTCSDPDNYSYLGVPKIIQGWVNRIEQNVGISAGYREILKDVITIDNFLPSYPFTQFNTPLHNATFALNINDPIVGDGIVDRRVFFYFAEEDSCKTDEELMRILCLSNSSYLYYAEQMKQIVNEMQFQYNKNYLSNLKVDYLHKKTTDWIICWRYWLTTLTMSNRSLVPIGGPIPQPGDIHTL